MAQSLQSLVSREYISRLEPMIGGAACVVAPTLARMALMPALGSALPFATYFPTVLLATLLWGVGWGAAVLITSGIVAAFLFIQPGAVAGSEAKLLAALALFLTMGSLILLTGTTLRRALIALQAARAADAVRKRELQHRLKNTLAIVQSFSSYLYRNTADKAAYHEALGSKIVALAEASEVLFAEQFEACALPEAAEIALAPFAFDPRLSLHGTAIRLEADACEPLVLALHELATNAHKYGALSSDAGRVELSWTVAPDNPSLCVLSWVEKHGPSVVPPVRAGLGQHLLKRQRGLEAVTLNYEPSGLVCEIIVRVAAS